MPSGEEIQRQLTGVWRMMLGKADGLRLLDLSADGFWNSFFAMVVAAPPLVVGWVGFANEVALLSDGASGRFSIVMRLATIDFATWIAPLIVLALVARKAGIADRFVHLVVASNWASALLAWIMLPPSLIGLVLPGPNPFNDFLSLLFFVAAMVLSWRVTNVATGKGPAVATAVFAGMFVVSLVTLFLLQGVLGLATVVQAPIE
jgi:hypothetical protein